MRGDVISNHSDSTKSLLIWSVSGGSRVLNKNVTKKCTGEGGGGSAFKEFFPPKKLFWLHPWSNSQHPIFERIQCQLYTDNMSAGSKFCIDGYMPDMRKRALSCRAKDDISQQTYIACLEPISVGKSLFQVQF